MNKPLHPLLGEISAEQFLAEYWQKRPLLIRAALPEFRSPISPDELAGLSLEEEVESRLVIEKDGTRPWEVRHGPLAESDYAQLPESHWTLLVQEINKHVPELASLFDYFDFIPHWRLDDIMLSYAEPQGSVGPHTDNYDVFLLQGMGKRHWQISSQQVSETDLIPNIDMRVMADFHPEEEWTLEPGDILYLPPNVPHHGVALDPCLTYSIGFRAPQQQAMLSHFFQTLLEDQETDPFYQDPDLQMQAHCGEVSEQSLVKIRAMIRALPMDDGHIDDWFSRYITEPMRGDGPPLPMPLEPEVLRRRLQQGEDLYRSEYSRFVFRRGAMKGLYVGGERFPLGDEQLELAALLCDQRHWPSTTLLASMQTPQDLELVTQLYNEGHLYLVDDD